MCFKLPPKTILSENCIDEGKHCAVIVFNQPVLMFRIAAQLACRSSKQGQASEYIKCLLSDPVQSVISITHVVIFGDYNFYLVYLTLVPQFILKLLIQVNPVKSPAWRGQLCKHQDAVMPYCFNILPVYRCNIHLVYCYNISVTALQ